MKPWKSVFLNLDKAACSCMAGQGGNGLEWLNKNESWWESCCCLLHKSSFGPFEFEFWRVLCVSHCAFRDDGTGHTVCEALIWVEVYTCKKPAVTWVVSADWLRFYSCRYASEMWRAEIGPQIMGGKIYISINCSHQSPWYGNLYCPCPLLIKTLLLFKGTVWLVCPLTVVKSAQKIWISFPR